MTTNREAISRLRNLIKAVNDDAFITDRYIHSLLLKHSKAILHRKDVEDKLMLNESLFETIPYVELIEIDKIEADCARIKTGCKIMRTKKKLPTLMTGTDGPLLRIVSSIDGSDIFQQCVAAVYVSMALSTTFKYNKTHYFWYKNGYLYFPNILWDAVSVEGMFEDSISGYCSTDENDCALAQDSTLKLPDYLFSEVENLVFQDLGMLFKIPEDTADDSKNILR
jgi:hypothetical protein